MKIMWSTDVDIPCCPGEILSEDGRSTLIQTDWDYPGVASNFGWSIRSVQKLYRDDFDYFAECGVYGCLLCGLLFYPIELCDCDGCCPECGEKVEKFEPCEHESTDGTVPCKSCGIKASDFISAAYDWLRDNDGAIVEDPGYFLEG